MPSDFPMNDPQQLWQNQPTEEYKMSADKLRHKAQQFDRKERLAAISAVVIGIALFLYFGWGCLTFSEKFHTFRFGPLGMWSMRLGLGILSLWSLYSAYKTYKLKWPSFAASDADLKTTLQSYRQQLEKRRDYSQHIWLRSGLIFCFLGMAMFVMPILIQDLATSPRLLANVAPLFGLLILWLAIFIPSLRRRRRRLTEEIEKLRAFEQQHPA